MGNRENRNVAFMVTTVVMSVLMCISSIVNGAIFAIVIGLCLMATLSAGLGYMYGKYEREGREVEIKLPKIELPKIEKKAKEEKPKIVASPNGETKVEGVCADDNGEKPEEKKGKSIEEILKSVMK